MANTSGTGSNPSLECLVGKHLFAEAYDEDNQVVVSWCLWDGGAVYDGDRLASDGQPLGWTPRYEVRIPNGWHRRLTDYRKEG